MELEIYKNKANIDMEKSIITYQNQISRISAGRANPKLISGIKFDYFDEPVTIEQVASISLPEAQQLLIKPYDIKSTKDIAAVITSMNLGLQIVNEGNQIRIKFPSLTTERRKELVKQLVKYTENAKVSIRQVRQDINKAIKKDLDLNEDIQKNYLDEIQKVTDSFITKIDLMTDEKEKELMTI